MTFALSYPDNNEVVGSTFVAHGLLAPDVLSVTGRLISYAPTQVTYAIQMHHFGPKGWLLVFTGLTQGDTYDLEILDHVGKCIATVTGLQVTGEATGTVISNPKNGDTVCPIFVAQGTVTGPDPHVNCARIVKGGVTTNGAVGVIGPYWWASFAAPEDGAYQLSVGKKADCSDATTINITVRQRGLRGRYDMIPRRHAKLVILASAMGCLTVVQTAVCQPQPAAPRVERILVGGGPEDLALTIHHNQLGASLRRPKSQVQIPATIAVGIAGKQVQLDRAEESDRWEDLVVYSVRSGPLTRQDQDAVAAELLRSQAWADRAGPIARYQDGQPHILLRTLIIEFVNSVAPQAGKQALLDAGAATVRSDRRNPRLFTAEFPKRPILDVFDGFHQDARVAWQAPDLLVPHVAPPSTTVAACEPWHHDNPGHGGQVADADIDTPLAWAFNRGQDVVIAVIDSGFERDHPDLVGNRWRNPGEIAGNGVDDDSNTKVDDLYGWNFHDDQPDVVIGTGHGTKAAGSVAAGGLHQPLILGSAPRAKLMLLQAQSVASIREAIQYASDYADVICIVYNLAAASGLPTAVADAVADGRAGRGCVVCCSMESATGSHKISELPTVVSVRDSASDETSSRPAALGKALRIMAPGERIMTTLPTTFPAATPCSKGYGAFWDASAATPVLAGAAALVLAEAPGLSWRQVCAVLQDTCDKIDPAAADYGPLNGLGEASASAYGYGRLNAFEAVRLVASRSAGGRARVDLLLRDNPWDWGNTERPSNSRFDAAATTIAHWTSPDVKLLSAAGPAPTTSQAFDAAASALATVGTPLRIGVRLRNRGPAAADGAVVRVFVVAGTTLPAFPGGSAGAWTSLGASPPVSLAYSGCSAAQDPASDPAAIHVWDWTPPAAGEYSLLAIAACPDDPLTPAAVSTDDVIISHNNVALKRVAVE